MRMRVDAAAMATIHTGRRSALRPVLITLLAASCLGLTSQEAAARSLPSADETLRGDATVIDGDTLRIGEIHIRLWGIDAPEAGQTCATQEPGPSARAALAELIEGNAVVCTIEGRDRYRRAVATCSVGGADLGKSMVRGGWAWDFPRYSKGAYHDLEQVAAAARLGVHAMTCEKPWDWRRTHPRELLKHP